MGSLSLTDWLTVHGHTLFTYHHYVLYTRICILIFLENKFPCLTKMSIGLLTGGTRSSVIGCLVDRCSHLKWLSLAGCRFNSSDVRKLLYHLRQCSHLEYLFLTDVCLVRYADVEIGREGEDHSKLFFCGFFESNAFALTVLKAHLTYLYTRKW